MGEGEGGGDLGDYFAASGGLGGFESYFLTSVHPGTRFPLAGEGG